MKNIKKSTWIAIGCVALAILASQMYRAAQSEVHEKEEVAALSAMHPGTTPSPISAPSAKPNKETVTAGVTETYAVSAASPAPQADEKQKEKTFRLPATGPMHRPFSDTELVKFEPLGIWRCHLGIDFLPAENDIVFAVSDGKVESIYEDPLFGKTLVIDHGNAVKSLYSSLSDADVKIGDSVSAGDAIGHMGDCAPAEDGVHLHFAMEKDGNPVDPMGEAL